MESDSDLVRRFQRGDEAAFGDLVDRFSDRVFRLASVWLYDSQLAADAAQDVFVRAHRGLRRFRFKAAPFTWLYRTTKNVCYEYNNRRGFEPLPDEPVSAAPPADSQLDQATIAARIRTLVAQLPERQRDVVMLRIFEELSVEQTAKVMGCRPGTVKAHLHKAIERLKLDKGVLTEGSDE